MNRIEAREAANAKIKAVVMAAKANGQEGLAGCSVNARGQASVKTSDTELYVTAEIPANGGVIEFFKNINLKEVGVTNFDVNKLNTLQNAVIDSVTLDYGTVATSVTDDWKTVVKDLAFDAKAPNALLNGKTKFDCNGKQLFEFLNSEIHNINSGNNRTDDFREVGHLPIIESQKPCTATLETPSGVSLGTARHFVKLVMKVNLTEERV